MNVKVIKFGGSSVADPAQIRKIREIHLNLKEDSPLGEYALRSGVAFTYLPPC